jgi:hypothetical protein
MKNYKRLTKRLISSNAPFTECAGYEEVLQRLAELEDKIENGTLIELPCAIGSMVYTIDHFEHEVVKCSFSIDMLREVGKTVFLDEYIAQNKLKEWEDLQLKKWKSFLNP